VCKKRGELCRKTSKRLPLQKKNRGAATSEKKTISQKEKEELKKRKKRALCDEDDESERAKIKRGIRESTNSFCFRQVCPFCSRVFFRFVILYWEKRD